MRWGRNKRLAEIFEQTRIERKKELPEVYKEAEFNLLENHIEKNFGKIETVFHEIVSPDIHLDIAIINPSPERNYYTLVTMGMGAHRMNVPKEFEEYNIRRAELAICLPSDWEINNDNENWYWPLRWLKIMARLPIDQSTWLGFGHTVPGGEPFCENTKFCCMLVSFLNQFGEAADSCPMPKGDQVVFYQLIPLYEEEMNFKLNNDANALLELMPKEMREVVNINRENVCLK